MRHGRRVVLFLGVLLFFLAFSPDGRGQTRRKVIVDQDSQSAVGMQALALLLQAPDVDVLGICVVSGNQWRDEEVARTLRLLELLGRTDVPVLPGAVFPLVHSRAQAKLWQERYGRLFYAGAWDERWYHDPDAVPELAEGAPHTKPSSEDAAHFLARVVRQYPHDVTVFALGPMTDLAAAISIDAQFPALARELVFMGGSLNPRSADPEITANPRFEFNFWFDPEAASAVLRAQWNKITCTPTDISIQATLTPDFMKRISAKGTPAARIMSQYYAPPAKAPYMWDEIAVAAWVEPAIVTKREALYMDVDTAQTAGYGNTLTWSEKFKPKYPLHQVEVQLELDVPRFESLVVNLLAAGGSGTAN